MAKGEARISSIYRLGETVPAEERHARAQERRASLYALLWHKHGLICIPEADLPTDDPLAQHMINIANEKYGRRRNA